MPPCGELAAEALPKLHDVTAAEALARALRDPDHDVRRLAAEALEVGGTPASLFDEEAGATRPCGRSSGE
jgi:HEAT repeat protein